MDEVRLYQMRGLKPITVWEIEHTYLFYTDLESDGRNNKAYSVVAIRICRNP